MKNFFLKVFTYGTEGLHLEDQRVVRLINTICVFTIGLTLLITLLNIFTAGYPPSTLIAGVLTAGFFGLPVWFNYKNKLNVAKWVTILLFNQVCLTGYFLSPYQMASWIVVITIFPLYIVLFSNKKTIFVLSTITFSFVCLYIYFQSQPGHVPLVEYDKDQIVITQMVYYLTSVLGLIFLMFFVKSNLSDHKEKLEEALKEKELLLKEVHHRVKNNLQVISSLFNIQERKLQENAISAKEVINAAQGRIQSMALVHEHLYNNEDLTLITLEPYIKRLCYNIMNIYHPLSDKVKLTIVGDEILLEIDNIIPIGLIINEAITNSFKYAFAETKSPEITISFKQIKTEIELEISDNGKGYKSLKTESKYRGIGLQLIDDMTMQLNGENTIKINNGVKHKIIFNHS